MIESHYKIDKGYKIPVDWEVITLGDLGEPLMCKRILKNQTGTSGDIPFYKIGTFGQNPDAFISKVLYEDYKSKYHYPRPGDVLISAAGTIGRHIVFDGKDSYFQDSNIVWLDNNEKIITNEFLSKWLDVIDWTTTDGGTITRLYNKNLKESIIVKPTKLEQSRIANALSDIDSLISILEDLIAKKRNLMQGAMQELLSGNRRLSGFRDEWVIKKISEVATTASGGTPYRGNERFFHGNIPWITTSELNDSFINDSKEKITEDGLCNSSAKVFPKNTLLIAMYGATIGKLGLLKIAAATNQACCAIQCHNVNVLFLFYYLLHKRGEILSLGSGAAQSNISQKIIREIPIRIPSHLDEQEEIAKVLSDMDAEISAIEARYEKYQAIKDGMMQQLLTGKIRLI